MTQTEGATVSSRWWYIIALVPVVAVVGVVLGGLRLRSVEWVAPAIVPYVYLAVFLLFAHPVALYFDANAVRRAQDDWTPDPVIYVAGAVLGITIPVFSPLVSIVYLRNRFRAIR